jgi:hypothetical protein
MRSFNEQIKPKASQGWNPYGAAVPEGWNNRRLPGIMTGLWFETSKPSIAMMTIGGTPGKGILFSWGERGTYQMFFSESDEGKQYKTVYSRAGRFGVSMCGEIESIHTIRCSEAALHGSTNQLHLLQGLRALDLHGTAVRVRFEDFEGLALRELVITGSEVAGALDGLSAQTELEVLRLSNVQGLTGDVGVIAEMPKLRRLDLHGCSGLDYTHRVLPAGWVAPEIDLSDMGLSAVAVDQFLNDLANTLVPDGKLNIAGNNAAHTAASDGAIAALRGAGWVVAVNEDGA